MTWARLDDAFWRNRKIRELSRQPKGAEAIALNVLTISWCAESLTDGVVDNSALAEIVPWHKSRVKSAVKSLVKSGVWEELNSGEKWRVHDFLEYNFSAEEVHVKREKDRHRQRNHRRMSQRDTFRDSTPMSQRESHDPRYPEGDKSPSRDMSTVDNVTSRHDELTMRASSRLASICRWGGEDEARAVVNALREHLDIAVVDELIGFCATLREQPRRPRYVLTVGQRWAAERGLQLPELRLPS